MILYLLSFYIFVVAMVFCGCRKFFNKLVGEYTILFLTIIILIVVIIGTFLFHIIEGWKFFDAFYFTTVTMATVGYGDISPLTHAGKSLAIIYSFMGAPLFVGLTSIFFQSRFQKMIKHSIRAYHKEVKESEMIALQNQKNLKKQEKEITSLQHEIS